MRNLLLDGRFRHHASLHLTINSVYKHHGTTMAAGSRRYISLAVAKLSSTQVRRILRREEALHPEFTRPAVAAILVANN